MALELRNYFVKSRHEPDRKSGKYHELTEPKAETSGAEYRKCEEGTDKKGIKNKDITVDRGNTVLSYGSLTAVSMGRIY